MTFFRFSILVIKKMKKCLLDLFYMIIIVNNKILCSTRWIEELSSDFESIVTFTNYHTYIQELFKIYIYNL